MIVGTYTLHLYCDNTKKHPDGFYEGDKKFPIEFVADGKDAYSVARRLARNAGWKLKSDGRCLCRNCRNRNLNP